MADPTTSVTLSADRRTRAAVLIAFVLFGLFWGTWGSTLPLLKQHAAVTDAGLGASLAWIGIGALFSIRLAGTLSDRLTRAVLAGSLVALAAGGLGSAHATGQLQLSVATFVIGVFAGASDAAANAAAARSEAAGAPVLNLAHGVFSVGVVVASVGVAAIAHRLTTPVPMDAVAVVLVIGAVLAAALTTPAPRRASDNAASRPPRLPAAVWRRLAAIGTLAAVAYLVENAWQSWGAIHLGQSIGAGAGAAAAAPAVFAASAAAGRFAGHRLDGRLRPALLLTLGAAVAGVGSVVAALATTTALGMAGIVVAGLGTSVCAPTLIAFAGRAAPNREGAATGTVITLAYLGFAFGPAIVGGLADAFTLSTALCVVAAGAIVLSGCAPLLGRRPDGLTTVR